MGDKSNIEWTDATWNPVRGCALVSAGCTNCYAMRQARRSSGAGGAYEGLTKLTSHGPVWTGAVALHPELLDMPMRWRRPRRIFVNSMSDLFHEDVSDSFIAAVFGVMAASPQHTFQILTKRPERARLWFDWVQDMPHASDVTVRRCIHFLDCAIDRKFHVDYPSWPLPNVWLGVSVEDQPRADERITELLDTPAAIRFLSCEPLLGPIDLRDAFRHQLCNALPNESGEIDWVIAGGESGPRARPSHPDWFRSLRDQCQVADVPFFFKQWGEWHPCHTEVHPDERGREVYPHEDAALERMIQRDLASDSQRDIPDSRRGWTIKEEHGQEFVRLGKKIAGNELDGRTHLEYPR